MFRARLRAASLVVALTLAFGAGYGAHAWTIPAAEPAAAQAAKEERYAGFNVFWEAWDLVQRNYVQPQQADPKALTYGAIAGMLRRDTSPFARPVSDAPGAKPWRKALAIGAGLGLAVALVAALVWGFWMGVLLAVPFMMLFASAAALTLAGHRWSSSWRFG